jgi:hypothetical protein
VTADDIASRDAAERSPLSRYAQEGEIVAINEQGRIYGLNSRTTGDRPEAMQAKLTQIDQLALASVTMTRAMLDQQRQTAWLREREEQREVERAAYVERRAAQLEHDPTVQTIGTAYAESRTGPEFIAMLEAHGLVVARVSDEDAERSKTQRDYGLRASFYKAGEYVAINEQGRTYRLDGTTIHDREEHIFARLSGIDASQQLTLSQARQVVEHQRQERRQEQWREWSEWKPPARPVQRGLHGLGKGADTAGRAAGAAGNVFGGIVRVTAPLLGALADFVTGIPSAPPVPHREEPPAPEPNRAETMQEQARRQSLETPSIDPQTEAIRRVSPQALSPEKEANIQRLLESQARARQRDNERDDGRER